MAIDLNGIKLEKWKNDPNVSVEISKRIESALWQESYFESLIGSGQDRALRTIAMQGIFLT